jgi:hypothetical protein
MFWGAALSVFFLVATPGVAFAGGSILAVMGVAHGAEEIQNGAPITGTIEIATSLLLPFGGRSASRGYGSKLPEGAGMLARARGLFADHTLYTPRPANVRPNIERQVMHLNRMRAARIMDLNNLRDARVAKLLRLRAAKMGFDPDIVEVHDRLPGPYKGSGGLSVRGKPGYGLDPTKVHIELSVFRRTGAGRANRGAMRAMYPTPSALLAHELSHFVLGTEHGGAQDTSLMAILNFYYRFGLISRAVARALRFSVRNGPPGSP